MFYQFTQSGVVSVPPESVDDSSLCAGYLTVEQLLQYSDRFGFDDSTVEACKNANALFRTGVEVHREYTFSELRILNDPDEDDDFIALYVKKNLFLVVDINDEDGSTKAKFNAVIHKHPYEKVCCERLLAAFLDSLLSGDLMALETLENRLSEQEEELLAKDIDKDFNGELLQIKKQLSERHTYYAQLLDIAEAVCENDNGLFDEDSLIYVDNISKRIERLREETAYLKNTVEHLQDAYSSYLDLALNKTMKWFTVLTSIFFPLTIIVGWYGMNFSSMPEFGWRYGYLYVILLSAVVVAAFAIIGKRKKWF